VDRGVIPLGELSLDQKQALAAHPNPSVAARVKALLERGGGLPAPHRPRVIAALAPGAPQGGDPHRGKDTLPPQGAKRHPHGGGGRSGRATAVRGGRLGPTSPAWPSTRARSSWCTSSTPAGASKGTSSSTRWRPPTAGSSTGCSPPSRRPPSSSLTPKARRRP